MLRIFTTPIPYGIIAALITTAFAVVEAKHKHWARAGAVLSAGLLSALVAAWSSLNLTAFETDVRVGNAVLRKQGEQNAILTKEVSNLVTGGDSFVYLHFEPNHQVLVKHVGKYPVYDIEIDTVNADKFRIDNSADFQEQLHAAQVAGSTTHMILPTITEKSKVALTRFPFSTEEESRFQVLIATRNGHYIEFVMLRKKDGGVAAAYRLFEDDPESRNIIREMISPYVGASFLGSTEITPDWSWTAK